MSAATALQAASLKPRRQGQKLLQLLPSWSIDLWGSSSLTIASHTRQVPHERLLDADVA